MEDLPVGAEIVLKVVETKETDCSGCFFNNDRCASGKLGLDCILPDGTGVIFKEVKE